MVIPIFFLLSDCRPLALHLENFSMIVCLLRERVVEMMAEEVKKDPFDMLDPPKLR